MFGAADQFLGARAFVLGPVGNRRELWSGPGSADRLGLAPLAVLLVDRGHGLELRGREVAQRRVSAGGVVEAFDELEDFADQRTAGRPGAPMDELLLQGREEALGDGVVVGAALGAHRDGDAGVAGLLPERETHE